MTFHDRFRLIYVGSLMSNLFCFILRLGLRLFSCVLKTAARIPVSIRRPEKHLCEARLIKQFSPFQFDTFFNVDTCRIYTFFVVVIIGGADAGGGD